MVQNKPIKLNVAMPTISFSHAFDFLPRLGEVLCTYVKSQRLKMSIAFISLQREFLGLLSFGLKLVKTNVAKNMA